ncbi:lipoate--protein ligase [Synergistales bacterium]|nr:lipoate--protein ligase [Synergistales bacterium]
MFVIKNSDTRPQYNLALEEYLCLKSLREGARFFMLWRNEPSIIVGRFQNTLSEINAPFVEERKIHVVRRNSGGGAVYHDLENINYSFIAPDDAGDFNFSFFTRPIIAALASLGVNAEVSGRNDIAIDGRKVSGGAQFRRSGVTLHHGTLLYDTDLETLGQALRPPEDKYKDKAVKSARARVANIKPFLAEPLTAIEFMTRLENEINARRPATLSAQELVEVESLKTEKYSSWEWNYGASPRFTEHKRARFAWGGIEAFLVVDGGKITECSFRGDYFGGGDYAPLLSRVLGCPYTKSGVSEACAGVKTDGAFYGSTAEDIISLLSPEI